MTPLIIGGLVVAVLAIAWALTRKSSVVQTPAGGVAPAGTPSAETPLPPAGVPASVVVVTPTVSQLTKKIIIVKETSSLPQEGGQRHLNIGEVYAYQGERLLTTADFSGAELFPGVFPGPYSASNAIDGDPNTTAHALPEDAPIKKLTLTLATPTHLTKVNVLNRQDCCWDRLEGAVLILLNNNDVEIFRKTLTGSRDLQVYPIS